ncbi:uncharacterized protein ARB_00899 [Trichophyton benhamiae CBS 112371]|uniref:Uncharacterized protein n=1 Tax=Arthroderma benhamiae (strain ATCC MYA-4681 / CBS 112371) TaxID=663331 RepID=D4AXI1_ARTBC|nr:uncharacterized protein ARB_00899 [Trichophyton benhamiae CBS 112371]EFE32009.1 hypothetical protein ARB_00899 [Trichophyton benhamiae CBS 112371]
MSNRREDGEADEDDELRSTVVVGDSLVGCVTAAGGGEGKQKAKKTEKKEKKEKKKVKVGVRV